MGWKYVRRQQAVYENETTRQPGAGKFSAALQTHFWLWGALSLSLLLPAVGSVLVAIGTRAKPATNGPKDVDLQVEAAVADTPISFLDSLSWLPLSWGVALLLAGFAFNILNQHHSRAVARSLEDKRSAHLTRFNDELSSVIGVFIELLQSEKDETASARFFSSAVREARHLVSHSGVRICVYQLELQEVDHSELDANDTADDTQLLVLKAFGGRADHPRDRFTPDTVHGRSVIAIAQGTSAVRISDPASVKFPVDRNKDAVWCSTLLVPLKRGSESKGVIMIDTRTQVDFSFEDVSIGWTIATIIALGMGSLVRGGQDSSPEMREARLLLEEIEKELH